MKIAVTGASGFIGQHVCRELARLGCDIVTVGRVGSSASMMDAERVVQDIRLDYAAPSSDQLDTLAACDALIHLAWGGLPNYGSNHHFEVELPLQYSFLKQVIERGLTSVLVTGTCFEYGMQSGMLSEDMSAHPVNPYGFAKYALYQQLSYLQQTHPFKMQWARLFYTYGEGQSANSLYTQLQAAFRQGEPVFRMSGGEQLRDFLSIVDMVKIIVQLAMTQENIGVVNVCSGQPVSVRGLVERWLKAQQSKIELDLGYYPYSAFEPMAFWGDVHKLNTALSFNGDHGLSVN